MPKIIIISNRLPLKISPKDDGTFEYKASAGGLATGLSSIYQQNDNVWLGWPGDFFEKKEEREEISRHLQQQHMRPVFLSARQKKLYYEGFSNETLWPNFHYFNEYTVYDESYWQAYKEVNALFLEKAVALAEEGDTIWVHDYHLLLLPALIRQKLPQARIGFFLHIPFPSYEVFRLIPWRKQLIDGVLGADLIGMHTYDDMRHFLSAVSRISFLSHKHGEIHLGARIIQVESFPMGIDYDKYASSASSAQTLKTEAQFRQSLGPVRVILSVDRLDYSKGIPKRLYAFERLLENYPRYQQQISLLMVVVPSRDNVRKYRHLKEEIDLLVGRINGRFGTVNWTPIQYFYRSFSLVEISAFYRLAEVALVTPMRDGMNLVAKEYVASRQDDKGVLILSEMAGAAKELSDALIVNPNDQKQVVEAIHQALSMPEEEQRQHIKQMAALLRKYDINHWVNLFLSHLDRQIKATAERGTKALTQTMIGDLIKHYQHSEQRQFFLDYDGTLQEFVSNPNEAEPDADLLELLEKLAHPPANQLIVISGRDRHSLDKWLGHLPIHLVAEHGVFVKAPGAEWQERRHLSEDWKDEIKPILEDYVNRTPGSLIEEKKYGLGWHYRKVEAAFGEKRAREIISHLRYLTLDRNLSVLEGLKVVEVKDRQISKGIATNELLKADPRNFILAIGDDYTDEDIFEMMPPYAHTIKVGSLNTQAGSYLEGVSEVRQLLWQLLED